MHLLFLGGYRNYDPQTRLFTKKDSFSSFISQKTSNGFNYTAGNPVRFTDKSGHIERTDGRGRESEMVDGLQQPSALVSPFPVRASSQRFEDDSSDGGGCLVGFETDPPPDDEEERPATPAPYHYNDHDLDEWAIASLPEAVDKAEDYDGKEVSKKIVSLKFSAGEGEEAQKVKFANQVEEISFQKFSNYQEHFYSQAEAQMNRTPERQVIQADEIEQALV